MRNHLLELVLWYMSRYRAGRARPTLKLHVTGEGLRWHMALVSIRKQTCHFLASLQQTNSYNILVGGGDNVALWFLIVAD